MFLIKLPPQATSFYKHPASIHNLLSIFDQHPSISNPQRRRVRAFGPGLVRGSVPDQPLFGGGGDPGPPHPTHSGQNSSFPDFLGFKNFDFMAKTKTQIICRSRRILHPYWVALGPTKARNHLVFDFIALPSNSRSPFCVSLCANCFFGIRIFLSLSYSLEKLSQILPKRVIAFFCFFCFEIPKEDSQKPTPRHLIHSKVIELKEMKLKDGSWRINQSEISIWSKNKNQHLMHSVILFNLSILFKNDLTHLLIFLKYVFFQTFHNFNKSNF